MKINDIVLIEAEQSKWKFYDFRDVASAVKSFIKNINQPGVSLSDVKDRVMRDRGVNLAARSFIQWWKGIRYNVISNPKYDPTSETTKSQLRGILEKKVRHDLRARTPDIQNDINLILDANDNLNTKQVLNAALNIISGAVSSAVSAELGGSVSMVGGGGPTTTTPDVVDDETTEADRIKKVRSTFYPYGEQVPDELFKTTTDDASPAKIGIAAYRDPGSDELYVKLRGKWYSAHPYGKQTINLDTTATVNDSRLDSLFKNLINNQDLDDPYAWYLLVNIEDSDTLYVLPRAVHLKWLADLENTPHVYRSVIRGPSSIAALNNK